MNNYHMTIRPGAMGRYCPGILLGLTLVLVTLKLAGVLHCGWLPVFSPLWAPALVLGGLLLVVMLVGAMIGPQT